MAFTDTATATILTAVDEPKGEKVSTPQDEPLYQIFPQSRIPVTKTHGTIWKSRRDDGLKVMELFREHWNECFEYYNNFQKVGRENVTPKGVFGRGDDVENVIYSAIQTLVPAVYAQNPEISFNTEADEMRDQAKLLERVIMALVKKKFAPGVDLKAKAKLAVANDLLTNTVAFKIDFVKVEEGSDRIIAQLNEIRAEIDKAKTPTEYREAEGKLMALDEAAATSTPAGPKLSVIPSGSLIIDPRVSNGSPLDATWMMEEIWLPTEFVHAKYMRKKGDAWELLYAEDHIVEGETETDDVGSLLNEITEAGETLGNLTEEQRAYVEANSERCWLCWDRTTKRVLLFLHEDMSWPLWVWDDPLKLSRFFPYFPIQLTQPLTGPYNVGEVSYVLDQQDAINKINREISRARDGAFSKFVYNSRAIDAENAKKLLNVLKGTGGEDVVGVKMPDGVEPDKAFKALVPPSSQYAELFEKDSIMSAIDRIMSTNNVLRGQEFRTNTTNDAVEAYVKSSNLRTGIKSDILEDVLADVCWGLTELMVQFAPREMIIDLVGQTRAQDWKTMSTAELNEDYEIVVVAGSTEKQTSQFKKEEALGVVQALGQFATAAPGTVIEIALKMLSQAFSEINLSEETWERLTQDITQQAQRGVSTTSTGAAAPAQETP